MELLAPAKINLFLNIVGRREDGYHLLRSLMCCVGLYDTVHINLPAGGNTIICDHDQVPSDKTNLALKAALLYNDCLLYETDLKPHDVLIRLKKNIPVGAGLGGGSSDAAAVLLGLDHYYQHPLSKDRLHLLALQLGADIPFFLEKRPSLVSGIGEQLEPVKGLPPMGVVLVYPGFTISTEAVYKNLNFGLTKCEKKLRYFPFNNGKFDLNQGLCNDLEKSVAQHFPVIVEIKKALLCQGALAASMTGSGSTVFGLFSSQTEAQSAKDRLIIKPGWQVFATELIVESK
jgi:4-diphosphocytidyl-2-C-methyl-D-erythritol kinase